jgi:hypothetical protein
MKEFKIRCSGIGDIIGNPKLKADKEAGNLSGTAKTFCESWLKEQIYSRRKEFTSKYTDKGNTMEDNAIDYATEQLNLGFALKNETFFENDFMTGTPDVILSDLIIDIKCSWDCFTFPLFSDEIPTKGYYDQLQGYMALTGKKKAKLVYCLMDTPADIIEKEAYWYCTNNGYGDLDMDIYEEFKNKMTYSNIDDKYRIKTYDVEFDKDHIELIELKVKKCREYIKSLI